MKFEKRTDGQEPSVPQTQPAAPAAKGGKKPVIIYIMIMFIVAFLLMTMSFFMHQRSNTEALGELQDSVNAMQAVQETQEKVIALQEQLSQSQDYIDKLTEENQGLKKTDAKSTAIMDAMMNLYLLQQSYSAQDFETCKTLIAQMEEAGQVELLPQEKQDGITPPQERFFQLKDAVLSK